MTLVTAVISHFNNAGTILDCIRSVYAQSIDDWKLIVLDDGSTDESRPPVSDLRDSRVQVLSRDTNMGPAVRLNELTNLVTTPYLARMDGDDLMDPRRLERAMTALESDESLSLVHGDAVSIDKHSRPLGRRTPGDDGSVRAHFVHSPYIHPTITGRTAWWAAHPYDSRYRRCQDQELWLRTIGHRSIRRLDGTQIYLREAGTVSASKYASSMRGTRQLLAQHGETHLGTAGTARLQALTFAKEVVYRGAESFGVVGSVVRSRVDSLSASEVAMHADVVAAIRTTPLPGIDI